MRKMIVSALICVFFAACKKDTPLNSYPLNIPELATYWGKAYENVAHHFAAFVVDSVVGLNSKAYVIRIEDKNAPIKHYGCSLRINEDKKIVSIELIARITEAKMCADNLAYFDKLLNDKGRLVSVQAMGDNGWNDPEIRTTHRLIEYIQKGGRNAWLLQYEMEDQYACVLSGELKSSDNFSIKVFPLL